MSFCPILVGCNLSLTPSQLDTPVVTLHATSKVITWDAVDNASEYYVYINNRRCQETVSASDSINSRLFDFSPYLSDLGDYSIQVVAKSNRRLISRSDYSEEVVYNYSYDNYCVPIPSDTTVETIDNINLNVQVNGTMVSYQKVSNSSVTAYKLYLYSSSTGLNVYTLGSTTVELQTSTYGLKNEIYALRLGVTKGGVDYVCSDIYYINPSDYYQGYTDNVYTFDGYINDYYITNLIELRNIVYYTFIYRDSSFDIKLSSDFQEKIISTYEGKDYRTKLINAVIDSFDYLYETRNMYSLNCQNISTAGREYRISINYDSYLNSSGLPACDISYLPVEGSYYPELEWAPSYERLSSYRTLRKDDTNYSTTPYDDFSSDKQFLATEVSTSEELYWAVENKVTPIVKSGSMAETIYNKAKDVLREIIADDMTDYEKTLAIFDWISANTVYDYYAVSEKETYNTSSVTIIPSYYLEGVFITGYAVCDGFSKAFSLLCNMEGIDAIRIVGTAVSGGSQGGHAWNKVLLDKNPDDGIDAEYYLVDITWSALVSSGSEVSTHQYFLVSDYEVYGTHYAYALRDKFFYYEALENYNYYNEGSFVYPLTKRDLVVDSDAKASIVFDYMLYEGVDTIEIVVDFAYMNSIHPISSLNSKEYTEMISALFERFRSIKFNEQYFHIYTNYDLVPYTTKGVTSDSELQGYGIILVLKHNLLIDSENEVGHLLTELNTNWHEREYDLHVTEEMLGVDADSIPEDEESRVAYYESLVRTLFGDMSKYKKISVSFEFEDIETVIVRENGTQEEETHYIFKMYVSGKTI